MAEPMLSIVVPVRNEEAVLPILHARLRAVCDQLGISCERIYVDDGSTDATAELLATIAYHDPETVIVSLSRNFGHQPAVCAGLDTARGEAIIVLDGDLQDPPELIPTLLERWREGYDVAYAVRRSRPEAWPKRLAYRGYYRLMRLVSETDMPLDAGDFGLVDRRVLRAMQTLPERMRMVRGLRAFVGFRSVAVPYDREPRAAGRTKYSLRKLVRLACDGIFGFSRAPLELVSFAGFGMVIVAALFGCWELCTTARPLSLLLTASAMVQCGGMAVLAEYARQALPEIKGRPTYIVSETSRVGSRERRREDIAA